MKNERHIYRLKNEPRSNGAQEDCQTQLIEYDDWMRLQEQKYSRLLAELNKACWLAQSSPYKNDMIKSLNEGILSELEKTQLTDDEIRQGCGLTMEEELLRQRKPSNNRECRDTSSTQHSIGFLYTQSLSGKNTFRVVSHDMFEPGMKEPVPWDSIVVESNKIVYQCWTGNRSISFAMHSNQKRKNDHTRIIFEYKTGKVI